MARILIAACAGKNQVIGDQGKLPWHFSTDLKFFKATTRGHAILMGRKTFDSIITQFGRPLPDRRHLVVTHNPTYHPFGAEVFHDLPSALAAVPDGEDLFIIGGQQIFEQALPYADKILLTRIERDYTGDAFFPAIAPGCWHLSAEKTEIENGVLLRFCTYLRA